jgi:hypothetical protein
MFNLYNGIWFYLDNYINKSTLKKEPVIAESGDYVYVSTVNKKLDNFEGYRVGSKSVVSSKVTVPMSAGFALSCTTLQNESSMVISFINSHDNLTKHIIRFRRMDFTNEIFTQKEATITDMLTPDFVKQSTELTDSFVKLGTTFVSLFNSSGSKDLVPIPTIGEVDLAPYLKSYISDPIRSVQCATVGKDSYFVLQPSVTTSGQYVYIKISQKESGINLKQESNVSLPQ